MTSTFTLQGVGARTEIWVANNLALPGRGLPQRRQRNVITDAQVTYFVDQFDEQHRAEDDGDLQLAAESRRDRRAAPALAPALFPTTTQGPGSKIVTLIANFRDENYRDITFPSYVAGYHSSDINDVRQPERDVDRLLRLAPPHGREPAERAVDRACHNRPAQPFKYEGVFAHEYQHLLEFWASPGEATWVNEGLSDYAITVTGYGFPARSIFEIGWDGHIQTFLGWRIAGDAGQPDPAAERRRRELAHDLGGPGRARDARRLRRRWTFMEFLAGRYGPAFMTDFHNEDVNGLAGLQAVLDRYLTGDDARDVVHEWAAMVALDRSIDDGAKLRGATREADYQADELYSAVNWANPQSYSTPGAPPNGSDYVQLRDGSGSAAGRGVVDPFSGPTHHTPPPMEWTSELQAGDAVLSAGAAANIDRSIVRSIAVPATGDRSLVFDTKYNIEPAGTSGSSRSRPTAVSAGRASTTRRRRPSTTAGRSARSSRSCRASAASPTGARRRSISPPTPGRPCCCGSG